MKVSVHAASTGIISLLILATTNWQNGLLFFIGGILVDVDHYLKFAWRVKNPSFIKAYKTCCELSEKIKKNPKQYLSLCHFHTIEFLIIVFALSLAWGSYFLFFGICFHFLLDILAMFIYHSVGVREISIIRFMFRKRKVEKEKIII
ncbi:hypothetical protein KKD19_00840 [Patescibacteria group bacterium]|nr:hypothetical protein [Patescibacteria group bacterium]MBU4511777.1 hypothetical protein [Patescibacteria group bacterium]MCG2692914.1 hypothetical protein [Candidatus Parcubacteria bacterium]